MSSSFSRCSAGSRRVTFNAIVSLLGQALGQIDVAPLAVLVAAVQQQDQHVAPPEIIDAVAGAVPYPQLLNAVADGLGVTEISSGESFQTVIDPQPGFAIAQAFEPVAKYIGLKDRDALSFIGDRGAFVNVVGHGRFQSVPRPEPR